MTTHELTTGDEIGVTTLEAFGSTRLTTVAGAYFFNGASGGPPLKMNGVNVAPGQFGAWTPLGVEQASNGTYQVVWKNGSADQYVVWTTDSNGNFLSQGSLLNGASVELQSLEPGFSQDLNGDGGITPRTPIESTGSTALATVAGVYVLSPSGSPLGPQLRMSGSLVTAGQFGNWNPIGAEQINGLYKVVWQNGSANQYVIWTVDGNGNFLSQTAALTNTSVELQSLEPGFNQDFNGDGITARTPIESAGSTALANVAGAYVLSPAGAALGPQLSISGALVAAGQFGAWTPIGAEQSGPNYLVVWKNAATNPNQYVTWSVDGSGNFLSQSAALSPTSFALEFLETAFGQDLNGDGTTGVTTASIESVGSTTLTKVADSVFDQLWIVARAVALRRHVRGGRPVRRMGSDRCGAGGKRLSDRLEERLRRSISRVEYRSQRQLPLAGRRRVWRELVRADVRNRHAPGSQR